MQNKNSHSGILESIGGVDTWGLIAAACSVDDGTTLPDIERPFCPNGTGGFRIPMKF